MKNKVQIKFLHLFISLAFFLVLTHFTISGFAPQPMVLIPAFPFCLLSVLPISWKYIGARNTIGIFGAGIGALISVLPVTALLAYDEMTGWKSGADIGLGLLYLFLPLYSAGFMAIGYFIGEMIILIRHRSFWRLPNIFRTIFLFAGIGFGFYFLFRSHSTYSLLRYYEKSDPPAAQLYEEELWLFLCRAGAAIFLSVAVYLISWRDKGAKYEVD